MLKISVLRAKFVVIGSDVVWKSSQRQAHNNHIAGSVMPKGYRIIHVTHRGRDHIIMAHRISWMLHNGRELKADEIIDHIDGNPVNNSPSNLRIVTNSQNSRNRSKALSNSASELMGVVWPPETRKWRASMRLNGKLLHLGYFEDAVQAVRAYWLYRKNTEPDMWPTWKAYYLKEKKLARKMFDVGCGPDGKPTNLIRCPIVGSRLLRLLELKNDIRLRKASNATTLLELVKLRLFIYRGILVWRSASGKCASIGCAAGNTRKDDDRLRIELRLRNRRLNLSTPVVGWMLHNNKELPSKARIIQVDGNKSNIALANLELRMPKRI